jgi:cell division protein FtsW (lipid II flippase)
LLEPLKTLFFSIKRLFWILQNDFGFTVKLGLFALVCIVVATTALTDSIYGFIPLFTLFVAAVLWADRREANKAEIDKLGEIQVTTEQQEKSIDEYVKLMTKKHAKQRSAKD